MNRRLLLALPILATVPLWSLSDLGPELSHAEAPPATQPSVDPADVINPSIDQADPTLAPPSQATGPAQGGAPGQGENRRSRVQRYLQPLTDKEVADAMQWMSQHSKNRFDAIQSLPDGERKTEIKNFTTRAYLSTMRVANEDPKLYSVVLKRVQLEDDIFGKVTQLKKESNPDKQKLLTDQLKGEVSKLLDIGFQERQLRLDRLSELIKKEQKQLDEDSANRPALEDERLKAILKGGESSTLVPKGVEGVGGGQTQHGRGPARP